MAPLKLREIFLRHERAVLGLGCLAALLIAWEIASRAHLIDPQFASRPSRIIEAIVALSNNGELWYNGWVTLSEFAVGYLLALVLGIAIGLVAGFWSGIGRFVDPILMALSATPRSALIPILIVWFGLGFNSKVVLVFLSGIIPIVINTTTGIRTSDPQLLRVARSFGAKPLDQAIHILIPSALPQIFSGLRIGLNLSLIGVIVAEMYVSVAGFGKMIVIYGGVLRIDELLAYILTISVVGCALVLLLGALERALVPWR